MPALTAGGPALDSPRRRLEGGIQSLLLTVIEPKPLPPPPQTKGTIVGNIKIYNREHLVGPFLVHKLFGLKPPPPSPPPHAQVSAGAGKPPHGLGGCIWMPLVNGTGNSPSPGIRGLR